MKITEEIREKIIISLPKNYARRIAQQTGASESTVYRVLHHEQENEEVAEALLELAATTKRMNQEKHKRRKKFVQQLSEDKAA